MGLYGSLRTSASGMAAQSNRISSVADNIANSNTTGYKRSAIEFATLVLSQGGDDYQSGSVKSNTQYFISQQGAMASTSRWSNVGIEGDGFFMVQNAGGQTFLTRAGAFIPTTGEGYLENAAGMRLMGYSLAGGSTPPLVINGTAGLEPIRLSALALQSTPTTAGYFRANLPINGGAAGAATPVVASGGGNLPSENQAAATPTKGPTSLVVYDNLGNSVTLDVYATRTTAAGGAADTWEMTVFNAADRATGGTFPYGAAALATEQLSFDASGNLMPSSAQGMSIPVPNGAAVALDLSTMSAKAATYDPDAEANGNAPSQVIGYDIANDGTLSAVYENGSRVETFRIPLATVPSPDKLAVQAGNTFLATQESGDFKMGFPSEGGRGTIQGYSVEQSNVDLANELTTMIESQRNYTANSKVFQTSAELMDVLVNLQR